MAADWTGMAAAPALTRFARSIVHDWAMAEDIVADVYARAWARRATLNGSASAWIRRCVHNLAIDKRRVGRRRGEILREELDKNLAQNDGDGSTWPLSPSTDEPDAEACRFEVAAVVRSEVNGLSRNCRLAITAVDMDGMSYELAARELRMPRGTIASLVHRGRARMAKTLSGFVGGAA